ncbi:MAG: hypothetical protein K2I56_08180 [Muribaculaceae bacterium]|nr:hypothetical protein [Muribaculaceae bacterium]
MATNNPQQTNATNVAVENNAADPGELLLAKAKANKKRIVALTVVVAAVLIAAFAWFFISKSNSRKADEAAATADMTLIKGGADADSLALPLYLKAAGMHGKSAERSEAMAGIILYQDKKYEEALKHFDNASLKGELAPVGVLIAKGNCYANLNKLDEALNCFLKAADKADDNAALAPYALVKAANVYHVQKNFAKEAECYETIVNDYPEYAANPYFDADPNDPAASNYNDGTQRDIRKYLERAKALAAGK